jgi:integrase
MRKTIEANERTKRAYTIYLRNAKGRDEATIDKALSAIRRFEESTRFKDFRQFHIEQAGRFKAALDRSRNKRTGKQLSHATVDATLRLVKAFFHWLAGRAGFKSRISYADVEYFNNNSKNARVAHARRDIPYPSMQQAIRAFDGMPHGTDLERRDKALFAFFMLTGARAGAVASLRLKHINLVEGHVFQDARQVQTKFSKSIHTWFFPVYPAYRACLEDWVTYLRSVKLFGPEDALFPKPDMGLSDGGGFAVIGLSRKGYSSGAKLNGIIRNAFAMVQMPEYTAHSFRKTLALHGDHVCQNMEQMKAWSLNFGHENIATTVGSYMPVSRQRQGELIKKLGKE